jgi:T5SS/PEP-CTERM-associated repeat protein
VVTFDPVATDTCDPDPTVLCVPPSGSTFPVGTTTVTCTVQDNAGNVAFCNFDVTVIDTTAPEITCPDDVTGVECEGTDGTVVTFDDPVATDLCDAAPTVVCDPASGSLFPSGTTTVTCTATDASGNTATCTFDVVVDDTIAPIVICGADQTATTDPDACESTAEWPEPTVVDNCDTDPAITYDVDLDDDGSLDAEGLETPSYPLPIGIHRIFPRATDANGNTGGGCAFTVTVSDMTGPVLTIPDDVDVQCDESTDPADTGEATAVDGCDPDPTVDFDDNVIDGGCPDALQVIERTWTATDALGNTTTATQVISVVDTVAPEVTDCPGDVTTPDCESNIVVWSPPTVSDVCDPSPTLVYDIDFGDNGTIDVAGLVNPTFAFPAGVNRVIARATDACGNENTDCSFVVTAVGQFLEVAMEMPFVTNAPFTRCIRFELFECPDATPDVVEVDLTFENGIAVQTVSIGCGTYTCVTARDPLHSLRRTATPMPIGGDTYAVNFTGADALIGGNINGDAFIDITDFGVLVSQFGEVLGADTPCGTMGPHADVTGDGFVTIGDFTFVANFFLELDESNCCGLPLQALNGLPGHGGPVTSVSIRELEAAGMGDLAVADLNHDGMLDELDMIAFTNGARPVVAARFTGEPGGSWTDASSWSNGRAPDEHTDVSLDRLVRIDGAEAVARMVTVEAGGELAMADGVLLAEGVSVEAGGVLSITGDSLLSAAWLELEPGAVLAWDGGVIEIDGGTFTTGAADLVVSGTTAPSVLRLLDGASAVVPGDVIVGDGDGQVGTVELDGASALLVGGALTVGHGGDGALTIAGGSLVSDQLGLVGVLEGSRGTVVVTGAGSTWTSAVHVDVGSAGDGRVTVEDGATVDAPTLLLGPYGVLRGDGVARASLEGDGLLRPLGVLTIDGDWTPGPGSALAVRLGAGGHDGLQVTGEVELDGTLRIEPGGRGVPAPGASATVVTAASIADGFAAIDAPPLRAPSRYAVVTTPTTVEVRVVAPEVSGRVR